MTLPKKAEKEYLQVAYSPDWPSITGQTAHVAELVALFKQRGIPCRREPSSRPDEERLLFEPDADVAVAKQILAAYKSAKGS